MFTVVHTTRNLSLDEHFIKHPAATFFVKVEGNGMDDHGIYKGETLIVDRSLTPEKNPTVTGSPYSGKSTFEMRRDALAKLTYDAKY